MRIQLLSDLHLETEAFAPRPAPGSDLLVLAGDIDSSWRSLSRFAGWPVPVLLVAGNHEFDGRDFDAAQSSLRMHCAAHGLRMLERDTLVLTGADGRRVRFLGTVRWCDFDLFGAAGRARALRAGAYFTRIMQAQRAGAVFDAAAMRDEALACRAWLEGELAAPRHGDCVATVVITHFAPSARSLDPRYGAQPASASFCNADDDLMPGVDLWLHGHLHCRHDYVVRHADGRRTRVVSQARGLARRGEGVGHDPLRVFDI